MRFATVTRSEGLSPRSFHIRAPRIIANPKTIRIALMHFVVAQSMQTLCCGSAPEERGTGIPICMVYADVRREPAQNSRQVVIRTSTKRSLVKTPFPAMRPERLFELMLHVKQPDSYRAGKKRYR